MKPTLKSSPAVRALLVALLAVAALWVIVRPSHSDLSVPFSYAGDALAAQTFIKGIIENGWTLRNPDLGAPGINEMQDFPLTDTFHLLAIKALSLVVHDSGLLLNVWFLLTFPLTALIAFAVLQHRGIAFPVATLGALLYAFQPYHFIRGEAHLFLASYYLIPLAVLVILWVAEGRGPFGAADNERSNRSEGGAAHSASFYGWASGLICAVFAIADAYYAFFACFFLVVAGILSALKLHSRRPIVAAGALVLVIIVCGLANLVPSFVYWAKYGTNPVAVQRAPAHAEIYGLKLVQLVMPIAAHRVPAVADAVEKYRRSAPLVTENASASLGLVGSAGFILLLVCLLYRRPAAPTLRDLAVFNAHAVLLGTIGGLGSALAYAGFSMIRAYNRVSIFIAFFALYAISIVLDRWYRRSVARGQSWIATALIVALVVVGLWDQTAPTWNLYHWSYSFDNSKVAEVYARDAAFIRSVEASVPAQASIYQLPYRHFPEEPPTQQLEDYAQFVPYLHSSRLHWSYGAMKGRSTDAWHDCVNQLDLRDFLQEIARAGFAGLLVHTSGYADRGEALLKTLHEATGRDPLVEPEGAMAFVALAGQGTPAAIRCELIAQWRSGFHELEGGGSSTWRWSSKRGELVVNNLTDKPVRVALTLSLATGHPESSRMIIDGDGRTDEFAVNDQGIPIEWTIGAAPGQTVLRFTSDAARVISPQDPRDLAFRVANFRMRKLPD